MRIVDYQRHLEHAYRLDIATVDPADATRIISGCLVPRSTGTSRVEIINAIPRFAPGDNYASNFGLQWNVFRSTQLDSQNGLRLSFCRFWINTRWKPRDLLGKAVLEIGSGAGRFTEILLDAGAIVTSVDCSDAVEANFRNNVSKGDVFVAQCDLYDLPFSDATFDYVFCYGVLQHTPDPDRAYQAMFAKLKPGGRISIDYYLKHRRPNVWATPKYIWRPVTTRMDPARLLRIIRAYIPLWFPIDNIVRSVPRIGPAILSVTPIPCWNPVGSGLSYRQRREWAIMDTFDALGAAYDEPRTLEEVRVMVQSDESAEVEVFRGSNGVVANLMKLDIDN